MLQATFRVSGSKLTSELLEKIKAFFNGKPEDYEVVITIRQKESPDDQKLRIDRSIEKIEGKKN